MACRSLRFRLVNAFAEESCWSCALAVIEDARGVGSGYAIFDFDRTIVAIDPGSAFLWGLCRGSLLRLALAIAVTPLALALAAPRTTRRWGLSFYVWVATVGTDGGDLRALCDQFADGYLARGRPAVFAGALDALRRRRAEGHRIAIVSGSLTWIVAAFLRRIDDGECTIVASTWRPFLGGFISARHCVGQQKVAMAALAGVPAQGRLAGYTDSASDIPMLQTCKTSYVVNPDVRTVARFRRAFGTHFEVVRWT
jgi:phosphatidylglycerophosphatase C